MLGFGQGGGGGGGGRGGGGEGRENVCPAAELKKLLPSIFVSLSLSIA